MLRTVNDQPTLWDAILPPELLVLPVELGRVDALLDDPVFFAPFAAYFDARIGRPSIPVETYLRLMFLKFRYRLGYESLCREVADSISWQRFCRIPLGTRVPHPTTLMKITTRCGDDAVAGLNEALLAKAAAAKLLRTDKVRADTTVVEAAVAYPTDSGLLAKAVGTMARTVARIKAAGGATGTRARDRRRSAGRRARSIASKLRLRGAAAPGSGPGRGAADHRGTRRHRRSGHARGRRGDAQRHARAACCHRAAQRPAAPGDQRPGHSCGTHRTRCGPDPQPPGRGDARVGHRLVSLHDVDARPIRKGRLGKPVEFGYKAQIVDNADGVILDHTVEIGNPPDAPQLVAGDRTDHPPHRAHATRGHRRPRLRRGLRRTRPTRPRRAQCGDPTQPVNPAAARREFEHRRAFRDKIKWRTGSEGRINHIKRSYGWNRTELTGMTAPGPGADTASSPTTWSRSAPSQHETNTRTPRQHLTAPPAHHHYSDKSFFRSK